MPFNISLKVYTRNCDPVTEIFSDKYNDPAIAERVDPSFVQTAMRRLASHSSRFGTVTMLRPVMLRPVNYSYQKEYFVWFGSRNELRCHVISDSRVQGRMIHETPGLFPVPNTKIDVKGLYSPAGVEEYFEGAIKSREMFAFSNGDRSVLISIGTSVWQTVRRESDQVLHHAEEINLLTPLGPLQVQNPKRVFSYGITQSEKVYNNRGESLSVFLDIAGLSDIVFGNSRGEIFFEEDSLTRISEKLIGGFSRDR